MWVWPGEVTLKPGRRDHKKPQEEACGHGNWLAGAWETQRLTLDPTVGEHSPAGPGEPQGEPTRKVTRVTQWMGSAPSQEGT